MKHILLNSKNLTVTVFCGNNSLSNTVHEFENEKKTFSSIYMKLKLPNQNKKNVGEKRWCSKWRIQEGARPNFVLFSMKEKIEFSPHFFWFKKSLIFDLLFSPQTLDFLQNWAATSKLIVKARCGHSDNPSTNSYTKISNPRYSTINSLIPSQNKLHKE